MEQNIKKNICIYMNMSHFVIHVKPSHLINHVSIVFFNTLVCFLKLFGGFCYLYLTNKVFCFLYHIYIIILSMFSIWGFYGGSSVNNPPANAGDMSSIPGLRRFPGEGNGNPLQYSGLGNPIDRGAWQAIVHGVVKVRHDL